MYVRHMSANIIKKIPNLMYITREFGKVSFPQHITYLALLFIVGLGVMLELKKS